MKALSILALLPVGFLVSACAPGPEGPGYGGPGYYGHDTVVVEGRDRDRGDYGHDAGYGGQSDYNRNVTDVNVNRTNINERNVNRTNVQDVTRTNVSQTNVRKRNVTAQQGKVRDTKRGTDRNDSRKNQDGSPVNGQ
jgi:hypothetical protein